MFKEANTLCRRVDLAVYRRSILLHPSFYSMGIALRPRQAKQTNIMGKLAGRTRTGVVSAPLFDLNSPYSPTMNKTGFLGTHDAN